MSVCSTPRSAVARAVLASLALLLGLRPLPASGQETPEGMALAGVVTDSAGRPLADVRVTVVELQRAVITGEEGRFRLTSVPSGRYTLEVRRPGYRTRLARWQDGRTTPLDIVLAEDRDPLPVEPLTVTVTRNAISPLESPLPTSSLGPEALDREYSVSLAHALEQLPGLRTLSTGREIGKPVVRGLTGSRVVVASEGLRLEEYGWSDEDAPSVDAALVDRVEVVRGPASVLYGPGAVGGVINVVPRPLPDASAGDPVMRTGGELTVATNNRETDLGLHAEGASGVWGWRAMVVGRRSEALHTPEGELENTGFGAVNGEVAAVRRGAWGSVTARYVRYGGEFKLLEEDAPPGGEEGEEEEAGPERKLSDDRLQLLGTFPVGSMSLETRLQGQRHHLIELEDDPEALEQGIRKEVEIFDLTLTTGVGEALLHHSLAPDVRGTVGVSGKLQSSASEGVIPLIPDADVSSASGFLMEQWEGEALTLMAGARTDVVRVDAPDATTRTFGSATWSAGAAWRPLPTVSVTGNVGRAWRAPTLFELFASGPRLGEARYEIGRSDLEEEHSVNVDVGLRVDAGPVRASVSAFRNDFDGFLFIQPTDEVRDGYRVFRYEQADAVLEGGEASLEVVASPFLTLSSRADYVRGTNETEDEPLPLMPPIRVNAGAEVHGDWGGFARRAYLRVEGEYVAEPDRLNPFDIDVGDHTLLNLAAGFTTGAVGREMEVDLQVHNATNASYRDFLSRYKAFALNPGRDVVLRVRMGF